MAWLEDIGFVNETIEKNTVAKQHVYDTLDQMSIRYIPSHSNFMVFDLKKYTGQFKRDMANESVFLQKATEKHEK